MIAEDLQADGNIQRFVKLRQKETRKTFNLGGNASEELTVGGRPLSSLTEEELKVHHADEDWEHWEDDEEVEKAAGQEEGGLEDRVARAKEVKAELAQERREQEGQLS